MHNSLPYGFNFDRDYIVDVIFREVSNTIVGSHAISRKSPQMLKLVIALFRVQSIAPIICSFTVYPANLYLLLVETPRMMTEIRAAYMANLLALLRTFHHFSKITHIFCDWTFNFLTRTYVLPPYGIFYCEGSLCRLGWLKSTVVVSWHYKSSPQSLACLKSREGIRKRKWARWFGHNSFTFLAVAIMSCIPTYYFLMMRMHQIIVGHTTSKWKLSWPQNFTVHRMELVIYIGLSTVAIANVVGFAVFCRDVNNHAELQKKPELEWLGARGGMHVIYSEPGVPSDFVHEVQIFAGSFAIFLPPLMFFAAHALYTLNRNASRALSSKTQALTRQLFDIFNFQLRGAVIFFVIPLSFVLATGVVDTREIFPASIYALLRFSALFFFSLNPAQFATIFILRNSTHRSILLKQIRKTELCAKIRHLVGPTIPKATITETI
uniref:G protein-coupled receptor n=1 Tax=Pristionchus pacificus TaxID=54126 RepID=A0A8R1UXN7_PRIPA